MEELFKDAAVFADKESGIPHFCVEPEKRGEFWRNLSKYSAGKPVSQALNAVMQGRSFDEVLERFLRNLSEKISSGEQPGLAEFVLSSKLILKKYFDLRQSDVSEFVKAKNSLLSAIYILTRYPNLKQEVLK